MELPEKGHSETCPLNITIDFILGPNPSIPDTCDYFLVSCDSQLDYCLLYCRGPCIPYTVSAHFDKGTQKLDEVRVQEGNVDLRVAVETINLPTVEKFTVPGDDGKKKLSVF